ncbi:MAG: Rieske 2Fe-2S domain-containing protein [Desulfobacteraceae bacterium]|jgi:nitrite reductase/ring-hydroxylating ferredoxin subunit
MQIKYVKRNFFQRLLGISATVKPADPNCWKYSKGMLSIDLTKAPELFEKEGALRFEGKDLPKRVLIIADDKQKYHAFHNRCTHAGHRRLDPVPGTKTVQCCSVGKSTYDLTGKNIFGPAPAPIETFTVTQTEKHLTISIT